MAKTTVAHLKITRDANGTEIFLKSEALHSLMSKFANGRTSMDYSDPKGEKKVWYFSNHYPDMIGNYSGELYNLMISTKLNEGVSLKMKTPTTKKWANDIAEKIRRDIERTISEYSTVQNIEMIFSTSSDVIRWNVPVISEND